MRNTCTHSHAARVRHILQADHGRRIAVIENEIGEIDIDSDLVSGG